MTIVVPDDVLNFEAWLPGYANPERGVDRRRFTMAVQWEARPAQWAAPTSLQPAEGRGISDQKAVAGPAATGDVE